MEKTGFVLRRTNLREDWGFDKAVPVNKYMYKLTPEEKKEAVLK